MRTTPPAWAVISFHMGQSVQARERERKGSQYNLHWMWITAHTRHIKTEFQIISSNIDDLKRCDLASAWGASMVHPLVTASDLLITDLDKAHIWRGSSVEEFLRWCSVFGSFNSRHSFAEARRWRCRCRRRRRLLGCCNFVAHPSSEYMKPPP